MNQAILPAGTRLTQGLNQAMRWWTQELNAAFAPQIARWFADEAAVVDLSCGAGQLRATDGTTMPPMDEAAPRALPQAWKNRDVRLTLDGAMVLQKRVVYPQATEESLHDAVAFDLDRQTPFAADQVFFHARVAGRDALRATIEVELTVVARSALREVLQALREGGSRVLGIGLAGDKGSPRIDLLPMAERPPRRLTQTQKINLALLAAALLLGLFALWIPVWQKREAVKALIPEVQKAEAEAEVSRRVDGEYTRLVGQYSFLTGKKYANYTALEVVEELSKLSPDTTWLSTLDIKTNAKAREVQLQGEAASASKMIELLEQSPLLQNATSRGQTTRGSQPNTERFSIATEIKPRPAPPAAPPEPVAAALPVVAPAATPPQAVSVPVAKQPAVPAATAPAAPAASTKARAVPTGKTS